MFKSLKKFRKAYDKDSTEFYIKIMSKFHKLDNSAQSEISAGAIISMAIALIIIAAIIPSAINTFYAYNTTTVEDNITVGWAVNGVEDTKATILWWLLPFIAIASVLYMIYKRMD